MDYKSNSSCSSPSKDQKNSDRCALPFGTTVPVLPVRNNLRRPNSSHFPQASRFHFRKGLATKCSWKCTAIVFIMLSVVLTAALSYISGKPFFLLNNQYSLICFFVSTASSLLNWSYQTSKACTVVVGENPETFPSSKATTSETNLSTSSRPKPASSSTSSSGGNYFVNLFAKPVYQRKRRQISSHEAQNTTIVDVTTIGDTTDGTTEVLHDSTSSQHDNSTLLHDETINVSESLTTISALVVETTNINTTSIRTETSSITTDDVTSSSTFSSIETTPILFSLSTKSYEDFVQEGVADVVESDVIKITAKDPIEIEAPVEEFMPKPEQLSHESNSMKPSDTENPEVQHDFPIYAYGQDEVEIVNLNDPITSTTKSSKEETNKNSNGSASDDLDEKKQTGQQKKSPDKNLLNNEVKDIFEEEDNKTLAESSAELQTSNLAPIKKIDFDKSNPHEFDTATSSNPPLSVSNPSLIPSPPTVQVVEIPSSDASRHSKRVFVNVTIAAEPDSEHPNNQPFYVLSVSVPTDGNSGFPGINIGGFSPPKPIYQETSFEVSSTEDSSTIDPTTKDPSSSVGTSTEVTPAKYPSPLMHRPYNFWGGECQCSCPCLEEMNSSTPQDNTSTTEDASLATEESIDTSSTTEFSTDTTDISSTIDDFNSTTETTDDWRSSDATACPEVTTALPPPPTILILEGRMSPEMA